MGLIKIFSGKESIAIKLQAAVEAENVKVTQRENKQNSGNAAIIELFIEENDFMKVRDAIEDFKKEDPDTAIKLMDKLQKRTDSKTRKLIQDIKHNVNE